MRRCSSNAVVDDRHKPAPEARTASERVLLNASQGVGLVALDRQPFHDDQVMTCAGIVELDDAIAVDHSTHILHLFFPFTGRGDLRAFRPRTGTRYASGPRQVTCRLLNDLKSCENRAGVTSPDQSYVKSASICAIIRDRE